MAVSFPAPIGGVPLKDDFAPSIVFASAFAILTAIGAYRLAKPATRTLAVLGPFLFCLEKYVYPSIVFYSHIFKVVSSVVTWSLRAIEAKNFPENPNRSLVVYFQVTLAIGYITSLWGCLVNLLRCVFVATTQGSRSSSQISLRENIGQGATDLAVREREPEAQLSTHDAQGLQQDKPRVRFWYRRMFGILWLLQWVPVGTGTAMANLYANAEPDATETQGVQAMR